MAASKALWWTIGGLGATAAAGGIGYVVWKKKQEEVPIVDEAEEYVTPSAPIEEILPEHPPGAYYDESIEGGVWFDPSLSSGSDPVWSDGIGNWYYPTDYFIAPEPEPEPEPPEPRPAPAPPLFTQPITQPITQPLKEAYRVQTVDRYAQVSAPMPTPYFSGAQPGSTQTEEQMEEEAAAEETTNGAISGGNGATAAEDVSTRAPSGVTFGPANLRGTRAMKAMMMKAMKLRGKSVRVQCRCGRGYVMSRKQLKSMKGRLPCICRHA